LSNAAGLTVLGNPVERGVLRIKLDKPAEITLHDQTGRQVYGSRQPAGASEVNVSRLAKGWYVVKVEEVVERIWIR
jgi:hypothetical protein